MLSAEELYARGVAASSGGRLTEARRLYARAASRATDPDLAAQIEVSTAYLDAEVGRMPEALAALEDVLARTDLSRRVQGIAVSQRGLLRARSGHSAEALADFSEALHLLGDSGESDPVLLGRVHLNRGNLHMSTGALGDARADFRRVLEVLGSAEVDHNYDKARFNLAYVDQLAGDLVPALKGVDEAGPRLAALGDFYQALWSHTRAEILIEAGLVSEGVETLRDAAASYGRRRLRTSQAEAELSLARALLVGDPARARTVAGRAARRFRDQQAETFALRSEAVGLMAGIGGNGRRPRLASAALELAGRLREHHSTRDADLLELFAVRSHLVREELDAAARLLDGLTPSEDAPVTQRLLWREHSAELARRQGRVADAFAHVRAGLADLHAWQTTFGSLDLQTNVVGHGRALAVAGLRLAVDEGTPAAVLEWSERARTLATRVTPVRPPADTAVADELAQVRWLQSLQPDADSEEGQRLASLKRDLRHHAWFAQETGGEVVEPATLPEVVDLLGPDTALAAWLTVRGRLLALTVTQDGAAVIPLGQVEEVMDLVRTLAVDLDMSAGEAAGPFAALHRAGLVEALARLDELLVAPLAPQLAGRQVVITPAAMLAGAPWTLLPSLAGRPLTVAPSATWWRDHRWTDGLDSAGFVAGPRLPQAGAEVAASADVWPGSRVLLGDAATEAAVTAMAGEVDVLHVAAHGRHAADNPLFSGLELIDGTWFGYDIDRLDRVPSLVLLSSCELGRSSVRFGEELIGMTAAWLHAGARAVIASPAAVNDTVAQQVLTALHRGLVSGLSPAAALAAAVPVADVDAPPAPFVCFGAGL